MTRPPSDGTIDLGAIKGVFVTCIVAVRKEDKIYMSGERGVSDDDMILASSTSKVWQLGPYIMGYAGAMDGERIRHNFKPSLPTGNNIQKFMYTKFIKELRDFYNDWWVDVSKDSDFGMIICVKGQIFEHSAADMSLTQYNNEYLTMGSGSSYAMGYLFATENQKDARKRSIGAVASAIKFSTSCMGPIDTVSI